jgi:flagellar motor switch protein FliN/FliY
MSDEGLNEGILAEGELSREDLDAVSELANISMGAAGSTLAMMLGGEVELSTPEVKEYANLAAFREPFGAEAKTLVMVRYTSGLSGTSLFILKNSDARRLVSKMLGSSEESETLSELETGALGELMSQLLNASATSLASVIHEPVEISNPEVLPYSVEALKQCLPQMITSASVASTVQLNLPEEAPVSIMEIKVVTEAKTQVEKLLSVEPAQTAEESEFSNMDELISEPAMAGARAQNKDVDPVTVRPVKFSSFDNQPNVYGEENKNLELVMDITLSLTVELGRTELSIKDVLELTRGSVIELDRVAGEPVDLMANGKLIAKGEVVVIEDNFGLRITSIVSPAERLRGLS